MRTLHILLVGLVAALLSSCSTAPEKNGGPTLNQALNEAFAPLYEISLVESGALDLVYCSVSFRNKNDRWPKDYAELSAFVKESNGYLTLGEFERVDVRPLPDDRFEIRCVRLGHTNEVKLTLGGPVDKK